MRIFSTGLKMTDTDLKITRTLAIGKFRMSKIYFVVKLCSTSDDYTDTSDKNDMTYD